jgi:DNA mismatch repair protein MutS
MLPSYGLGGSVWPARMANGGVLYSGRSVSETIQVDEARAAAEQTPVMRQYFAAKEAHPDCLMFCRIGDFYELFYEDAIVAARELQLTLTARDREKKQPMCGVPYHAAEQYIQRLLRKGYRVALCEQMEDPKLTKKIVRREVTRVLTPGTVVDSGLGAEQSNWLASVCVRGAGAATCVGLAQMDLSTGEFRATEFSGTSAWSQLVDEVGRVRPVEMLFAETGLAGVQGGRQATLRDAGVAADSGEGGEFDGVRTRTRLEDWVYTADYALPLLRKQLGVQSLDGMGLAGHEVAATAAGALVHYLQKTMQGGLEHIDSIRFYERAGCLVLDAVSVRNLELVEPLFSGESVQTTLLRTMDECCTPMGKRLLRATLLRPSSDLAEIDARLDAVAEATGDLPRREGLRRAMGGLLDLERLLGRVALDSAGPREVMALGATLACLPGVREAVERFEAQRWKDLGNGFSSKISTGEHGSSAHISNDLSHEGGISTTVGFDAMEDLHELIAMAIVDEPPVNLVDGGVIRAGVDAELDELRELGRSGRQALVAIEERERQRTGIGSLKVRFNSVFGYYLEVTKANARSVPADYERKQTLVNAERFTTPELKEYEAKILTAQERSLEIERRLFAELRRQLLDAAGRMRQTARRVAEIDMLACFAHLSALRGWVRPKVEASGLLEFVAARHPVVERRMEDSGGGRFVPNSISLEGWGGAGFYDPTLHDETVKDGAPELRGATTHFSEPRPGATGLSGPPGASIALVTGPNMGGKSTYLRMAALLVVMAQCGCFVPAEQMRLGLVDRIYTRIGASDNVARGRSTFMVEMTETAAILNTATAQSLVLLDEMGRGTATYDGLSLAWSSVEYLHDKIGARTLFATHYHELTLLGERLARLKNLRVTVKETKSGIVFLHTVEAGAASKSYGIEVARLAGLPVGVIARAREVLKLHERAETQQVALALKAADEKEQPLQMTMFTPLSQKVVDRLAAVDVDGLTPREALNLLAELQREMGASS